MLAQLNYWAALPEIAPSLRLGTRVLSVGREGLLKHEEIATAERGRRSFRLLLADETGREWTEKADVVIDATGTWGHPNTLGDAGIPTYGLWAQVPHYVAGNPCPPAVRALLDQVRSIARVEVDLSELDADADSYAAKVEEGLAERPDVAELVSAIETETEEEVSGDEIAAEIERFLRDQ